MGHSIEYQYRETSIFLWWDAPYRACHAPRRLNSAQTIPPDGIKCPACGATGSWITKDEFVKRHWPLVTQAVKKVLTSKTNPA